MYHSSSRGHNTTEAHRNNGLPIYKQRSQVWSASNLAQSKRLHASCMRQATGHRQIFKVFGTALDYIHGILHLWALIQVLPRVRMSRCLAKAADILVSGPMPSRLLHSSQKGHAILTQHLQPISVYFNVGTVWYTLPLTFALVAGIKGANS